MAHNEQREFILAVKEAHPEHFVGGRILEIGSLDINGTVRDFFEFPAEYVGVDVGPGPGVDVVMNGADYESELYFDVTISTECFEHNPDWRETFANMVLFTRPGGLVIFTCAGFGRPEHGTSRSDVGSSPLTVEIGWEYYENREVEDFTSEDLEGMDYRFYYHPQACDLYFVGRRNGPLADIKAREEWK